MSGKRSVVYSTGERIDPEMVTNIPSLNRYAQQELGLSLPVGNGRRQGWSKFCKREMEQQLWDIKDLVRAVKYIKQTHAKCDTIYGILWYVDEARQWEQRRAVRVASDDLQAKVAYAIAVAPRRTVCGREATADWFKSEDTLGFFSSNDCRQCFFGWSKSGR